MKIYIKVDETLIEYKSDVLPEKRQQIVLENVYYSIIDISWINEGKRLIPILHVIYIKIGE